MIPSAMIRKYPELLRSMQSNISSIIPSKNPIKVVTNLDLKFQIADLLFIFIIRKIINMTIFGRATKTIFAQSSMVSKI